MCLYNLKDIACSKNKFFDNSCEKENIEMHKSYEDDKYYEDFGEFNNQDLISSASTDSNANNVQRKKRFSTSSVKNAAKKMLTDTNIFEKPLSQFNINAVSGNFVNVYISTHTHTHTILLICVYIYIYIYIYTQINKIHFIDNNSKYM